MFIPFPRILIQSLNLTGVQIKLLQHISHEDSPFLSHLGVIVLKGYSTLPSLLCLFLE